MRGLGFYIYLVVSGCAFAQVGTISTIAGTSRGFTGDGGPAVEASLALANVQNECDPGAFEQGVHLAVDAAGNVLIADGNNHRIRRIDPLGTIATVAGTGQRPVINGRCEPASPVGEGVPAVAARLFNPADVAVLPNGDLIIADQQNNRLRRVDSAGVITTVAGSGLHTIYAPNIPATSSPMDWPSALAVDPNGTIYFAEVHSNRVAKIGPDGRIVTVAGEGRVGGFGGDGGPALAARLNNPTGIALDRAGNLYIADQRNNRIRKVTPNGIITTIAGPETLNTPMDVKVDAADNVYIADTLNHRVQRLNPSGAIETVAGDGVPGRGPDNVPATQSSLRNPAGLAIDAKGDLYIADWQNFLIRKVSFGAPRPSVVNAASFAGTALAPGTIVSIIGANLGGSVEVNGTPIPLFFSSPGQINAQLPFSLAAGGIATLTVRNANTVVASGQFDVSSSSPGVFQLDANGRAAALNQDSSINSAENPGRLGNAVVIFLTGLGAVTPAIDAGQSTPSDVLTRATLPVTATIGGVEAEVLFAGMTPGSIGLAQVNLRIPQSIAPGSAVPVSVKAGDRVSNTVTISVRE